MLSATDGVGRNQGHGQPGCDRRFASTSLPAHGRISDRHRAAPGSAIVFHGCRKDTNDPDLLDVNTRWEQALQKAMQELPMIRFDDVESSQPGTMNTDFILRPESVRKGLRD